MSERTKYIKELDKVFAEWIKRRDEYRCTYCGRTDVPLDASHYFIRGHMGTRFDPLNVDTQCRICHSRIGSTKEHEMWKRAQLGNKRFYYMKRRAEETRKWTLKELDEMYEYYSKSV